MKIGNVLKMAGSILILIGVGFTIYDIVTGDGNVLITNSKGFYIFIVGLLLNVGSKQFNKREE